MRKILWVSFFLVLTFILPSRGMGGADFPPVPIEGMRAGQMLEREDLTRLLSDHLQNILHDSDRRVEIRDFRNFDKIAAPRGTLTCEIGLPAQAVRGGNVSGFMNFRAGGEEWKKIRFSARVDIYADVLVARHYLKKHQEIQREDIQVENRNIANLPPDLLTLEKEIVGKRTLLSVNRSEVLRESMVEIPPVVKKGDRVLLLVENAVFRITTVGEVKESGRRGDRVKLINLSSKKEVLGRVLDANTVQVDY